MRSNLPYEEHGGIDPSELKRNGLSIDSLVDFSVNSNPFGPSPCVSGALRDVDISRYPDRNNNGLIERLAELNNTCEDQVLAGNGTAELIWLIAHAFIRTGEKVLIIGPTFSEYRRAAQQVGASISEITAVSPDFAPPLEEAVQFIEIHQPRLVFFCNPNNPTGKYVPDEMVQKLVSSCNPESILVIDKAYSSFRDGIFFEKQPLQNVMVLRSMTKDFALAGLRLGYLLGNAQSIEKMKAFQPAWSVNAFAQAAGLAALSDLEYYRHSLKLLKDIQTPFFAELGSIGYHVVDSDIHFALVGSGLPAGMFRSRLLRTGCQVRDCTSFGLPDYVRICARLKEENRKLITEMKSMKTDLSGLS